jgi:hypothetical protein
LSSFAESNVVSPKELEAYALEYQAQYTRLSDENVGLTSHLTDFSNFTFFEFHDYSITEVISSTHGAALFFDPLNKPNRIYLEQISEPIEYYFWPEMTTDTKTLPIIRIAEGEYPLDSTISAQYGLLYVDPEATVRFTVKGKTFNFTDNAAITVFGTVIQEHSLLLKGSNNKEDWSIAQAGIDALSEFTWDLRSAGVDDYAIKNLGAKYKIPFLLSKIALRMESGEYRNNPAVFYSDYEDLKSAAAGTMNETLTNVLTDYYLKQQQRQLSFWEKANAFFVQNTLGVAIISFIAGIASTIAVPFILRLFKRALSLVHNIKAVQLFFRNHANIHLSPQCPFINNGFPCSLVAVAFQGSKILPLNLIV